MSKAAPEIGKWIGRREAARDVAAAGPVIGLAATLDRDDPPPRPGDAVPPGWHWLYFPTRARHSELGPDGHPRRGGFIPPIKLPKRMFAGARMRFHRPLRIGEEIRREDEIADVKEKQGRSGKLVFVTIRYRVSGEAGLAIEEEQDIVYREATRAGPPTPPIPAEIRGTDWRRTIHPDPVLLFRFSALTFIGHRIHYDHLYATEVEGYRGLLVHGPLTALLLLELCRDNCPQRPIAGYRFQARRPLFVNEPFQVAGRMDEGGESCTLQAADPEGLVAMTGAVTFAAGRGGAAPVRAESE